MDADVTLTTYGYNEGFMLLPDEAHSMAKAILALGRSGNLMAGMVPPLLVHLFAVVEPDADDRDHHRGAMMFLAHEGGFTAMPSPMVGGEAMGMRPGLPDWVLDERFTNLMTEMERVLQAEINVVPNGDSITVLVVPTFLMNSREEPESYAEQVMSYQSAVRAAAASIIGADPGYIPILIPSAADPLKDMGINAATPVPPADPVDKVILPTRDLRFGDRVKVYEIAKRDPNPIKSPDDEVFLVQGVSVKSSERGYHELLYIASTNVCGQYDRDFQGYRWEVIERPDPEVLKERYNSKS